MIKLIISVIVYTIMGLIVVKLLSIKFKLCKESYNDYFGLGIVVLIWPILIAIIIIAPFILLIGKIANKIILKEE